MPPPPVLPLPLDGRFDDKPGLKQAYDSLLAYEASHPYNPLPARWLGHLLREAPVKDSLAKEISSCLDQEEKIHDLWIFYRDRFLRLFKSSEGPTPAPTEHPSRNSPDYDAEVYTYLQANHNIPRDYDQAKRAALMRDGYRCTSGIYDYDWTGAEMEGAEVYRGGTNAAHIIPYSLNYHQGKVDDKGKLDHRTWSVSVSEVLERLGGVLPDEVSGAKINRLSNIITMSLDHHDAFNRLYWWMEPVSETDETHYKVKSIWNIGDLPQEIHFTTSDPRFELPNPKYIALHAACCRAAHLSGALKHVEDLYREIEDARTLPGDGSAASLLDFALSRLAVAHVDIDTVIRNDDLGHL